MEGRYLDIYSRLKKTLLFQMAGGAGLSLIIIFVTVLLKYEKIIVQEPVRLEAINKNAQKMRAEISRMDALEKKIELMLPAEYKTRSHKEIILLTLDSIKNRIKGSQITITNFEETGGELSLQTNLSISISDWNIFVNDLRYLQTLRFPSFASKNIVIEAKEGAKAPVCRIEGYLRMPAERLI